MARCAYDSPYLGYGIGLASNEAKIISFHPTWEEAEDALREALLKRDEHHGYIFTNCFVNEVDEVVFYRRYTYSRGSLLL